MVYKTTGKYHALEKQGCSPITNIFYKNNAVNPSDSTTVTIRICFNNVMRILFIYLIIIISCSVVKIHSNPNAHYL